MDTEQESALRTELAERLGIRPGKLGKIGTNALLEMTAARADALMAKNPSLPQVFFADALRALYTQLAEAIPAGEPLEKTTCGQGTVNMARNPAARRL